ncbi:MAG: copper chaperone PCu(A)C [Variibacter sp.]|nr:copper chaperone PCu(A)C [Variibacter sp.]
MTTHLPRRRTALLLALGALAAVVGSSHAQPVRVGDIEIVQAWSRATPQGAKVAAGYLEIINRGSVADTLVAVDTPISARGELHEMSMKDNVMTMRPVAGGIPIAPGQTVKLAPGGLHLMFMDVKQPLKQGETFTATLQFQRAGKVEVSFAVQGIGAGAPRTGHGH